MQPDARGVLIRGCYARRVGTSVAVGSKHIPASPFRPRCHGICQRTGNIEARLCVGGEIDEHHILVTGIALRCRHTVLRKTRIARTVALSIYNAQAARLKQLHLETVIPRIEAVIVLHQPCLHYQHPAAAVAQQRHAGVAAVVETTAPSERFHLGTSRNVRSQWLAVIAGGRNARAEPDGAVGIGRELGVGSSPQRKGEPDVAHIRKPRRRVVAVNDSRVRTADIHPCGGVHTRGEAPSVNNLLSLCRHSECGGDNYSE